jgi:hypothetical protein
VRSSEASIGAFEGGWYVGTDGESSNSHPAFLTTRRARVNVSGTALLLFSVL